jgi:hypothetical protein
VLNRPGQRPRQSLDNAIIAIEHVIALVAEDAEWCEFRATVGVDDEQKVQTALPVRLEAVLSDVGFTDGGFRNPTRGLVRAVLTFEIGLEPCYRIFPSQECTPGASCPVLATYSTYDPG